MFDAKGFDRDYYERFYLRGRTRSAVVARAARTADLIFGAVRHYDIDVRRIVDLGAGTGVLLRAVARHFPRARTLGVEFSPWAAERYGWVEGSLLEFDDAAGFDLVICNDVMQYLDDGTAARAIDHVAGLCRGLTDLTATTAVDLEETADLQRTDVRGHFRSAAWYRRRLNRHFSGVGSGLYLKADEAPAVWELERIEHCGPTSQPVGEGGWTNEAFGARASFRARAGARTGRFGGHWARRRRHGSLR